MSTTIFPVFVVTAYRWGQRNAHSYVVGCFPNLLEAKKCADDYMDYRGGKYGCEVCETYPWSEAAEDSEEKTRQVYYVESPYYGMAGDSGHFHPADRNKRSMPSEKPFTVRELQNRIFWLERFEKRMHWLHDCSTGNTDPEGFEWGIYRVKWVNGQAAEVWQTNSDFSDLDREMHRESSHTQPTKIS